MIRRLLALAGVDLLIKAGSQLLILLNARVLGVQEFGVLGVALAAFSLVIAFADLGVGESGTIAGIRGALDSHRFLQDLARVRFVTSVGLSLVAIALLWPIGQVWSHLTSIFLVSLPAAISSQSMYYANRIDGRYGQAGAFLSGYVIPQNLGFVLGYVTSGGSLALAAMGSSGLTIAYSVFLWRRFGVARPRNLTFSWIRNGLPIALTAACVAVYTRGDRILLGFLAPERETGEYVAAYNIVMIVAVLASSLQASLIPSFTGVRAQTKWRRGLAYLILGSALSALVLVLLSHHIVIAMYGRQYEASAEVLMMLAPLVVLYTVNPFLSAWLLGGGHFKTIAMIAGINLMVGALVAYPMIDRYAANGAAIASIAIEGAGFLMLYTACARHDSRLHPKVESA